MESSFSGIFRVFLEVFFKRDEGTPRRKIRSQQLQKKEMDEVVEEGQEEETLNGKKKRKAYQTRKNLVTGEKVIVGLRQAQASPSLHLHTIVELVALGLFGAQWVPPL